MSVVPFQRICIIVLSYSICNGPTTFLSADPFGRQRQNLKAKNWRCSHHFPDTFPSPVSSRRFAKGDGCAPCAAAHNPALLQSIFTNIGEAS